MRLKIVFASFMLSFTACKESLPPDQPDAKPMKAETEKTGDASIFSIPNAVRHSDGTLTGGQPSDEQLKDAKEQGFKTIINLRTAGEDADKQGAQVEALGMKSVWLPIAGKKGLTAENARRLAKALEESPKPVVLHCGSGQRVGALMALKAHFTDGEASAKALEMPPRSCPFIPQRVQKAPTSMAPTARGRTMLNQASPATACQPLASANVAKFPELPFMKRISGISTAQAKRPPEKVMAASFGPMTNPTPMRAGEAAGDW